MANKRMFSKDITNSDDFIDMPLSSQALYFHLGMNADDDGFASPKSICRLVQAKDDDLKILIYKKFVIEFESGVIVITHRKVNNNLRGDRYSPTIYKREYAQLVYNGLEYTLPTIGMHSIVKSSIDKISIVEDIATPPKPKKKFIPPTLEQVVSYFVEQGYIARAGEKAWNYYNVADWTDSKGTKIKNWKQKMQGVWFKDENKDKTKSRGLTEAQRQERLNALPN